MMTLLEESGDSDPVLYTDCSDVPYIVDLSDRENFEIVAKSSKDFFVNFWVRKR